MSDALVCLEDICPTLLDLCGLPAPDGLGELDGKSLVPVMRGEQARVRETLYSEIDYGSGQHWLQEGPWKYIWFGVTQEEQIFNVDDDPRELHDRSGEEAARLKPLRETLARNLQGRDAQEHWIGQAVWDFDPAACRPCANQPPKAIWGD